MPANILKDLLVGQILWVSNGQLIATALLSVVLLLVWRWQQARLGNLGFLHVVRLGGHRIGTAGRRVFGVRQPDRSGTRHLSHQTTASGVCLWHRHRRLCHRTIAIRMVRSAVWRDYRMGDDYGWAVGSAA